MRVGDRLPAAGDVVSADELLHRAGLHLGWIVRRLAAANRTVGDVLERELVEVDDIESVDVLVLTVTDIESEKLSEALHSAGYRGRQIHCRTNSYWVYGPIGGALVAWVRSSMGSGGQGGSILTIVDAIRDLSPASVIGLGIAFGMDEKMQPIGTVLISDSVSDYELKKLGTDSGGARVEISRGGHRVPASSRLLSRFRDAHLHEDGIVVKVGEILSGSKLIDNSEEKAALRAAFPNAIGGEMEVVGIQTACGREQKDWIMVKAVCDYAEQKSRNKVAR